MTVIRRWWHHPDRWALLSTTIYLCLLPGTLVSVALDIVPPEGAFFGGILLALQGIAVAFWLWARLRRARIRVITSIMLVAGIVEYVGATYDIPFGAYDYTTTLGWRIADTVPVVIVLAWLFSAKATWLCAFLFLPHAPTWQRAMLAGVCIVIFDMQIEPVATIIYQYWVWHDTGLYYGVPWVNFLGWWLTGTGLAWASDAAFRRGLVSLPTPLPIPLWHLLACMALFLVMNMRDQHWLAALISLGAIAGVWLVLRRWVVLTDAHRRQAIDLVTGHDERIDVVVHR